MDINMDTPSLKISPEILRVVAGIDEFKGAWKAFQNIAPDRLNLLRKVATVESVGSSMRPLEPSICGAVGRREPVRIRARSPAGTSQAKATRSPAATPSAKAKTTVPAVASSPTNRPTAAQVPRNKPAATPAAINVTGVFKSRTEHDGEVYSATITLQQNGVRITGRLTTVLVGEPVNQPINATLRGNRIVADSGDDKEGQVTVSPDSNTLTLTLTATQEVMVFKRVK
jgi:hypothetical protein